MNCTNCGSAGTRSTNGFCGSCGSIEPFANYGPPPVSPAVGFARYGFEAGYGVDEGGLPNGPTAGRPYGPAARFGQATPIHMATQQAAGPARRQAATQAAPEQSPVTAPPAMLTAAQEAAPVTAPPAMLTTALEAAPVTAPPAMLTAALEAAPVTAPPAMLTAAQEAAPGRAGGLAEAPVTAPPMSRGGLPALYGTPSETPNRFSVVALVLAGLALVFLPAGLAAIVFGSRARALGEALGPSSFAVSMATTIVGGLVGAAVVFLALL